METDHNPNDPSKPNGHERAQQLDREKQERERQQREREKQGRGHQQGGR